MLEVNFLRILREFILGNGPKRNFTMCRRIRLRLIIWSATRSSPRNSIVIESFLMTGWQRGILEKVKNPPVLFVITETIGKGAVGSIQNTKSTDWTAMETDFPISGKSSMDVTRRMVALPMNLIVGAGRPKAGRAGGSEIILSAFRAFLNSVCRANLLL